MDSDDIMMPNRLQLQFDYFLENRVDILGGGAKLFPNSRKKYLHPKIIDPTWIIENNIEHFLNHPTVMFRKHVVQALGGYNVNMKGMSEDYDLWIRALIKKYHIHNLHDILIKYRISENQLSSMFDKHAVEFRKINREQLAYFVSR